MKKTTLSRLFTCFAAVFCLIFAFSCSADKTGRREFQKTMLSDFSAELDYLIDFDGNPLAGNAVITKADVLRLDVLSPDPYSGISVECDAAGEADVISISYSGIKAEVPKAAMEKLVFLMDMMSESTARQLEKVNKSEYTQCGDVYVSQDFPQAVPYEVRFSCDDTDYIFIYDSITGMPMELFADNEYCKAEIKIKELKTDSLVSEE